MRPIDADALLEKAHDVILQNGAKHRCVCKEDIREAPTIELPAQCIANVIVDTDAILKRIKEEYDLIDGWISVEEKLPDKPGSYLVTAAGLPQYVPEYTTTLSYGKPDGLDVDTDVFYSYDEYWGEKICDDIIAWMPMPEPYKKTTQDKPEGIEKEE